MNETEQGLRIIHAAMLVAVQGVALIVLWHYYESEIRKFWAECKRRYAELTAAPARLTGKFWDDVEEAMRLDYC